ncbi:MAG: septal ring lytic transglycosylase RlpA family protein, partial [Bryobacteraceae bacterium]|nr:septal ring lytic transglycosylase RlpA family protein [Bryobacteraceae bacterium]
METPNCSNRNMGPSAGITRRSLGAALAALLAACAKKKTPPLPAAPVPGWTETGIASWYGRPYHGRRAASGEIYDMEQLTAAHRTLPFGTWVLVRNLDNQRTVTVRIHDRGPFVEGRIVDLSRAAA